MENNTKVSSGTRTSDDAACSVGSTGNAVQGQAIQTTAGGQHFIEPAHRPESATTSSDQSSASAKLPTKDQMKERVSAAAADVKDSARQSADQVRQQAGEAAARLKEQGAALLGQQKNRLVEEVSNVSAAVREAANKLHGEQDDNIASYIDAVADQIDRAGDYLRNADVQSLVSDATRLARSRPELFAGGMFVAGLTLARFLKASAAPRDRSASIHVRDDRSSARTHEQFRHSETSRSVYSSGERGLGVNAGPTMAGMPTAPTNRAQETPDSMRSGGPTMANPSACSTPR